VNARVNAIINEYRSILIADGMVAKKELINMLKADEEINYEECDYEKFADKILESPEPVSEKKSVKEVMEERLNLYKEGKSDIEIAFLQGVGITTICSWRKANNLPTNFRPQKLSDIENMARMKLYKERLTDKELATKLKISYQAAYEWRKKRRLPSNFRKKG
jgi:transposase